MHKNSLDVERIKNEKYGKLVALKEVERFFKEKNDRRKYLRFFLCKCDCGNEVIVRLDYLRAWKTKGTSSCGCLKHRKGNKNPLWSGFGKISGSLMKSIKSSAKIRSLDFSIDAKFLNSLFDRQNGKCALSGMELIMPEPNKKNAWTASVDRIDSSKGYVEGNVQWVHKKINMMKQDLSDEEFVDFCKQVVEYKSN